MQWKDEGYLLSKTNLGENSIIIETFTLNHGKYSGIVYGGSSRKQKKICRFKKSGIKYIDYKDPIFLKQFINYI